MNMKKTSIAIFSVIGIAIISLAVTSIIIKHKKIEIQRPKVILPANQKETEDIALKELYMSTEFENVSLIPLRIEETLISTLGIDFNGDTYEDQVIGIKRASNPEIIVIFGEYNPKKSSYERTIEIQTRITQVKTFNFSAMDLLGTHVDAIIFSGFSENNNSIMQGFIPIKSGSSVKLKKIVDFDIDGTILIQQNTRSDSYSIYNENEEPFSIVTNTTEEKSDGKGFDQIQTTYEWDKKKAEYVETNVTRVSSRRVAAKELSRIQDGTVETFMGFLDGLWYKTNDNSKTEHSIFFSPSENEIIFCTDEIQEVYDMINTSLRRYGIFISSSNKSISNLVRYFHIDLVSANEIRIRITDDVRMIIGTDADWDGIYKKKIDKTTTKKELKEKTDESKICSILENGNGRWDLQGDSVIFNDKSFKFYENGKEHEGTYTSMSLFDTELLQFRADEKDCILNGFFMYKLSGERLDLIAVKLSTEGCIISGKSFPIRLEKFKSN